MWVSVESTSRDQERRVGCTSPHVSTGTPLAVCLCRRGAVERTRGVRKRGGEGDISREQNVDSPKPRMKPGVGKDSPGKTREGRSSATDFGSVVVAFDVESPGRLPLFALVRWSYRVEVE